MDNVGIVVDDLTATIDFFRELGLELEGREMGSRVQRSANPQGLLPAPV
jgi:catechol 2,3-dioxygenase-like lactoylglutathione lyase family enzyme